MDAVLPLDQMTTEEKLRAMESLWADLSRKADSFESPAWHADVLRERDRRIAEGKESSIDWEEAKRQLRARLT
ncbi:MAG: addiction module protein [Opitutaceae bacterium]